MTGNSHFNVFLERQLTGNSHFNVVFFFWLLTVDWL